MRIDPICKTEVDENTSIYSSSFQGKTQYFCSTQCKNRFEQGPQSGEQARGREAFDRRIGERRREVIGKVKEHSKPILENQKNRAAEKLDHLAKAFRQSGKAFEQENGGSVSRYADQIAEKIEDASRYFRTREISELIEDIDGVIRRQPALAIGGSIALGFFLARFLKSSRETISHEF